MLKRLLVAAMAVLPILGCSDSKEQSEIPKNPVPMENPGGAAKAGTVGPKGAGGQRAQPLN